MGHASADPDDRSGWKRPRSRTIAVVVSTVVVRGGHRTIFVTTPSGTSPVVAADDFTYVSST